MQADEWPARSPGSRGGARLLKLLSLLLAIIVWYAIREAISFETVVSDVPLLILHDEGWAVLERSDETVDIRFRGSRADLADLSRERIRATVDVRGTKIDRARTVVAIGPENVRAPGGARAVELEPAEISFSVDREGERQVPVKADVLDAPPDGYEVERTVCVPATVVLRGPLSKLQDIEAVHTAPIELEGRITSFKTRRALVAPLGFATTRMEPDRVQVEVTLVEHAMTRKIEGVPLGVLRLPGSDAAVDVRPSRVDVEFAGRDGVLRGLLPETVRAYVDATRLAGGARYDLPAQVSAPPGLRVVSITPDIVNVQMGTP